MCYGFMGIQILVRKVRQDSAGAKKAVLCFWHIWNVKLNHFSGSADVAS